MQGTVVLGADRALNELEFVQLAPESNDSLSISLCLVS